MNDLNQCNFIGRLGKDPETRYTGNGDPVVSFSIACGWKSKDKEGTEWVNVTAFGNLAGIIDQYLKKGSQVYISGRYTTDKYEKDGQTRYSTKIIADRMQMLGGRGESQPAQQPADYPKDKEGTGAAPSGGDGFDDIPFGPMPYF